MNPRDYHSSKPLPVHLNVTPDNVAYYVKRALASYLCVHEPGAAEMNRPCRNCLATVEPLVLPVAKALTWVITEAKISAGAAVEILIRDADFELKHFQRTAAAKPPRTSEGYAVAGIEPPK